MKTIDHSLLWAVTGLVLAAGTLPAQAFDGAKARSAVEKAICARRYPAGIGGHMLDHVGFAVKDYAKAKAFYEKALKPLGIGVVMEVTPEQAGEDVHAAGFGEEQKPYFWIGTGDKPKGGQHVAFAAQDRKAVDEFHAAAIAAGGRDNGEPGLRPIYHPDYYGAFVFDPDGNNIEAVCHRPE